MEGSLSATYDSVELGTFVALRLAVDFVLAGAELAEVLGGARGLVREELKGDAAEGLAWEGMVLAGWAWGTCCGVLWWPAVVTDRARSGCSARVRLPCFPASFCRRVP